MCDDAVFRSKGRGATTGQKHQGVAIPAEEPLRDEIVDESRSLFLREIDAGHFGSSKRSRPGYLDIEHARVDW